MCEALNVKSLLKRGFPFGGSRGLLCIDAAPRRRAPDRIGARHHYIAVAAQFWTLNPVLHTGCVIPMQPVVVVMAAQLGANPFVLWGLVRIFWARSFGYFLTGRPASSSSPCTPLTHTTRAIYGGHNNGNIHVFWYNIIRLFYDVINKVECYKYHRMMSGKYPRGWYNCHVSNFKISRQNQRLFIQVLCLFGIM